MVGNVKVRIGAKTRYRRTPVYRPGSQHIRMELAAGRIAQLKRDLTWEERDAYLNIDESPLYNLAVANRQETDSSAMDSAPFGEEGHEISHEGGDHEVFDNVVVELTQANGFNRYRRYDLRNRQDRTLRRNAAWEPQMEALTNAYLHWYQGLPPPRLLGGEIVTTITCIDVFELKPLTISRHPGVAYVNVALVRNGALGCAPHGPTICFTLRTFEDYRQCRRFNPRMTIQSQVRKFCALHNVPFRHYLVTQFSIAYDVYLDIQRRVEARVNKALGRDSPQWRLRNSCPACEYRLENEIPLTFSKLIALDGNNSLRRIDPTITKSTSIVLDNREGTSDIWIKADEVNRFKDEVKTKLTGTSASQAINIEEEAGEGDVTDSVPEVTACVERWRAAGPEARKRMWRMFVESGIFIAVCRHGFILVLCDMVQSGELAKYPLALVDRLLDVFGSDLAIGYDIGCAFSSTIRNSSLNDKATQLNLRMLVPSFHGYAHNRSCQLQWHPMYISGAGIEDFETCERVFSQSNALASSTRHASTFHRTQALEEYFKFWDEDKYSYLSQFLFDNYLQALKIISSEAALLDEFNERNSFTAMMYESFIQDERTYLERLKERWVPNDLEVAYVKALEELEAVEAEYYYLAGLWDTVHEGDSIANLSRRLMSVLSTHGLHSNHVIQLEEKLHIPQDGRWNRDHPQRIGVIDRLNHQDYCKAVDNLERLVVSRLFELTKLNQSGTAYKMRRQIQKQLQSRSEAIKTAIKKYNRLASLLSPPRQQLDLNQVLDYAFLAEFDLLKNSRENVCDQPWALPVNREYTQRYFKVKAAREEIIRLNVEIRRLITSIQDERSFFPMKIAELQNSDPSLAFLIEQRWRYRDSINRSHVQTLQKIQNLPGFSGTLQPGKRQSTGQGLERANQDSADTITLFDLTSSSVEEMGTFTEGEMSEDDEILEMAAALETWHIALD